MDQQAFNLKQRYLEQQNCFGVAAPLFFPVSRQSPEGPSNLAWPKVTRQTGAQDMGSPSDFFANSEFVRPNSHNRSSDPPHCSLGNLERVAEHCIRVAGFD